MRVTMAIPQGSLKNKFCELLVVIWCCLLSFFKITRPLE